MVASTLDESLRAGHRLGLGSYLGSPDLATDDRYSAAARAFHRLGGQVFDTAANYRGGRSERALGEAFVHFPRDSFFLSTKAGYLPMGDGITQESPSSWFQRVLARPGILSADEVVDGCHAMTPAYLSHQLDISRQALGLERIDLFHLHNPEQQRPALGPEGFRSVLQKAFEACEVFVASGRIGSYGCATWNGFRVPPEAPDHLSLEELIGIAEEIAGADHHFRWIQAPLNLAMPEAFLEATQRFHGQALTLLEAASQAGIRVQTSASLMQARILHSLPEEFVQALGGRSPAQAALQFTRSCPGVTVALCGMSRIEHVQENASVMDLPVLEQEVLEAIFSGEAMES